MKTPTYTTSFWDDRYLTGEYVYGTEPNGFLVSVADKIPPGLVLCLAEGEGRNAVYLAGLGHDVTAVDQSAVGLRKAEALAHARGVAIKTESADLEDYTIPANHWSAVVAVFMHLPPPLRRMVLARAAAGLKPGGVFIMEAYTPAQLKNDTGGPRDPDLLVSTADLRAELSGLEIEFIRELDRDVHEGSGHTGRAAVVQALARKPFSS